MSFSLSTERLLLRLPQLTDAADVQRLAGHRDIAATTANIPHPYNDGVAEEWITQTVAAVERDDELTLVIIEREGGQLVGACGVSNNREHANGFLGYWIGKPWWGRGYCTEAARAVVDAAFDRFKLHRVYAYHFAGNPASGRVMQKIGMKYEGRQRQQFRKGDTFHDVVLYGVLRSEWNPIIAT